uniref:Uncharacterized protein n=1 Tax=Octopus bimaculoides TaxID=37653 RepID=A0A0L8G682_OCTBM
MNAIVFVFVFFSKYTELKTVLILIKINIERKLFYFIYVKKDVLIKKYNFKLTHM